MSADFSFYFNRMSHFLLDNTSRFGWGMNLLNSINVWPEIHMERKMNTNTRSSLCGMIITCRQQSHYKDQKWNCYGPWVSTYNNSLACTFNDACKNKCLCWNLSEWVMCIANAANFQLYHGENKIIFNEMMMRSALL